MPTTLDAFQRLVETGWDLEAQQRPHGQRTTVVVHLDVERTIGALHLGPLLTDAERQYLTCDATCEVWFERHGEVIGSGPVDPYHQPPAAAGVGAPRPLLCGAGMRGHPRSAWPSDSALGGRRPD